jgi:hypothetical protein
MKKTLFLFLILLVAGPEVFAGSSNLILDAAKEELARTMDELKNEENPPYFISYGITETTRYMLFASFGKIKKVIDSKDRILDIDLRVGDHQFDNSHIVRGSRFNFSFGSGTVHLPLEDDKAAIRNAIWHATDKQFKGAVEKYDKALTNQAVKVKEEDSSADFSYEKAYKYRGKKAKLAIDKKYWKDRVRRLSAEFKGNDWLYRGDVIFSAEIITKYFVSSEGTELMFPQTYIRMYLDGKTKAEDGMSLPLYKSYFSFTAENLPDDKTVQADIAKMIDLLDQLRNSEKLDKTYSGPAILSGEASGVFFHEIFGHRVEGHREKDPNSSQTFKNSIGEKILPDFITVVMDPTRNMIDDKEISGFYVR